MIWTGTARDALGRQASVSIPIGSPAFGCGATPYKDWPLHLYGGIERSIDPTLATLVNYKSATNDKVAHWADSRNFEAQHRAFFSKLNDGVQRVLILNHEPAGEGSQTDFHTCINYLAPLARSVIPGIKVGLAWFENAWDNPTSGVLPWIQGIDPDNYDYLCADRYCTQLSQSDFTVRMKPVVDFVGPRGKRIIISETGAVASLAQPFYTTMLTPDPLIDGVFGWFSRGPGGDFRAVPSVQPYLDAIAANFSRTFGAS